MPADSPATPPVRFGTAPLPEEDAAPSECRFDSWFPRNKAAAATDNTLLHNASVEYTRVSWSDNENVPGY